MKEKILKLDLGEKIIIIDSTTGVGIKVENKNYKLLIQDCVSFNDINIKIKNVSQNSLRCLFYVQDLYNHSRHLPGKLQEDVNELLDYFYVQTQGNDRPDGKILKEEQFQNIITFEDDFI